MNVPLKLVRRSGAPAAADAFLLFADGYGELAAACARLGPAVPAVYAVRGGFLLVPPQAEAKPLPGAVRLRRPSGDLFLPVDATLSPALLPDEVAALTRDRGLVLLPGGEVLAFDPADPLPVGRWLAPPRVRRSGWEPFPTPPARAERLTVIERPTPPDVALAVLDAGKPDGADPLPGAGADPEDARPPAGPLAGRVAAGVSLGVGRALAWLGRALAAPGLARLGGTLARRAVERVPRLTEKLFGAQEAALREVLRQLQSGDVERALRRAPAAVADPDAPARIGTTADLARRDPRYSLRDLLGLGEGAAAGWLGGGGVWDQLAAEYRRLAAEAAARGDHRRAAYLYGVLLRDLRAAANALMAGGLFRDAAVLYRDKLRDEPTAAAAFEKAGDYDEAIRLYMWRHQFEPAGDLLRRLGDHARAADYYARAADRLAGAGEYHAAGDLMRTKAGDSPAAEPYYRLGWESGGAEAAACGARLLDGYLAAGSWPRVAALLDEAEELFAPPRAADAARFFNYAVTAGKNLLPAGAADDLADRARLFFAGHLRAGGRGLGDLLFDRAGGWAGPVVRDAAFAAGAREHRPDAAPAVPTVQLAPGTVTAVAVARNANDLVVATTAEVVVWRPAEGRVVPVCSAAGRRVVGLSADPDGRVIYLVVADSADVFLRCFVETPGQGFRAMGQAGLGGTSADEDFGPYYLEPCVVFADGDYRVTVAGSSRRMGVTGPYLKFGSADPFTPDALSTRLLVRDGDAAAWDWADGDIAYLFGSAPARPRYSWRPHWDPDESAVRPIDWITPARGVLEVAGIDRDGVLHWSEFDARNPGSPHVRSASADECRYRTACVAFPRLVAAASADGEVHWLRVIEGKLRRFSSVRLPVPVPVVALVPWAAPHELLVLFADGSAARLPAK